MRLFFSLISSTLFFSVTAQQINIIPKPQSVKQPKIAGSFSITPSTLIISEGSNLDNAANFLNDYLLKNYALELKIVPNSTGKNVIRLNFERMDHTIAGAYKMNIDKNGIYIAGDNEAGVFYGIQTLIQLLPIPHPNTEVTGSRIRSFQIPQLTITDYPRFPYRGMHLDCGRHFWSVDFIKNYIDYLALHKFNTFHWHLTEDQGWRIEIKKYPKLTSVGGWRNGTIIGRYPGRGNDGIKYGGYYTREQIKEIVKYAADRYITVVPEIELPGHSSAAIAAYPELSCFPDEPTIKYFPKQCKWNGDSSGKQVQQTWGVFDDVFCAGQENTFKFLEDVMDEVLELFPSKYIHVGGDECPKNNWKRCTHCQKRIKENNLKDEHELQSYFIQRMEKYLNDKGRTLIGWDEILEGGLAPNAVVMSWRGEKGGIEAAKLKHDVIMTPGNPVYFDHTQSENEDSVTIGGYNPVEKVYAYEPVPKELTEEEGKYVLGAQANVWTEYMKNTKKAEYMIFPRMAALSEVVWSKKENREPASAGWKDFEKRLMAQFRRYDLWKVNYSKAYFELKAAVAPHPAYKGVIWKLESKKTSSVIRYNKQLDITDPPNPPAFNTYSGPVQIVKSGIYSAWSAENGIRADNTITQQFHFNKATGKKITIAVAPSKSYPGDGPFTLVNGVQNEQGLSKAKQFLGFSGTNCEAVIDLIKPESISRVTIHALRDEGAWIWQPQTLQVFIRDEKGDWQSMGLTDDFKGISNGTMTIEFSSVKTQQVKVIITNWGEIPAGNSGAGSQAWLFVDEIEVN